MRITIVGGGNIGTQFAVHCAEKGHEVVIFTSQPQLINRHLCIVDENSTVTHEGEIKLATNDPIMAFKESDLILVTVPSNIMNHTAEIIYDNTDSSSIIGVVPGNGGSECAFKKCIERGNIFFGIERVPAIARLVEKGKVVKSTGYRDELHVSSIPMSKVHLCSKIVNDIFDIKTYAISNFLNLTMTPSNPILHTTRLRTIFSDWHEGVKYKYVPLFYEEWDDQSSELLFACDEEVQSICRALPDFSLNHVISLKDHYESQTVDAMTKKISSIIPFKGLKTPTIEVDGGLIPDLHSRYFTADFSYGLTIIKQIANFAGVFTPHIDETMNWYKGIAIIKEEFKYEDYHINNYDSFKAFYMI